MSRYPSSEFVNEEEQDNNDNLVETSQSEKVVCNKFVTENSSDKYVNSHTDTNNDSANNNESEQSQNISNYMKQMVMNFMIVVERLFYISLIIVKKLHLCQ